MKARSIVLAGAGALLFSLVGCELDRAGRISPPPLVPLHGPPPPVALPDQPPGPASAFDLNQRLQILMDENKTLQAHVHRLDKMLEDRLRELNEASQAIKTTKEEVASLRQDLPRYQQQIADLQDRLKMAQTENLNNLRVVSQLVQQMVEMGAQPPANLQVPKAESKE